MRKIRKIFQNKIVKGILRTISIIIEILILFIVTIILVQRFTNNDKAFLGLRIFNVATGSMEPSLNVGDIILSKEIDSNKIKVGDVIVYKGNKMDLNGKIITHKVIEIETAENGELLFHTKGIANVVEDPIVKESQIYGTVICSSPILSSLFKVIGNRYVLYFCVILPIIIWAFVSFVKSNAEKYRGKDE